MGLARVNLQRHHLFTMSLNALERLSHTGAPHQNRAVFASSDAHINTGECTVESDTYIRTYSMYSMREEKSYKDVMSIYRKTDLKEQYGHVQYVYKITTDCIYVSL